MKKLLTALAMSVFSLSAPAYGAVIQTSPFFGLSPGLVAIPTTILEDGGIATLTRSPDSVEFVMEVNNVPPGT